MLISIPWRSFIQKASGNDGKERGLESDTHGSNLDSLLRDELCDFRPISKTL